MARRRIQTRRVPRNLKRRKRRVINYKRLMLVLFLAALSVVLTVILFTSPALEIKEERVVGAKIVKPAEVMRSLVMASGSNILLLKKKPIVESILRNPVVKEARLYRKFPSTVIARIVERAPAMSLDTGKGFFAVDASGIPYRTIPSPIPGLPVIVLEPESNLMPKPPVLGKRLTFRNFDGIVETLKVARREGLPGVGKISVDQNGDLCLNVRGKYEVKLGQPDALLAKIRTVIETERKAGGQGAVEYIDVSCPEAPAYKPRKIDSSSAP